MVVTIAALASLSFGTWAAHADHGSVQTYKTHVTIQYRAKTDSFVGHLGTRRLCKEGRVVDVVKIDSGVVGSDASDSHGRWGDVPSAGPGIYYATVSATSVGGYGSDKVCEAGTSRIISVP
jgi:hypothetical protein